MDVVLLVRLVIGASAAFLLGATAVVTIKYTYAWVSHGRPKKGGLLPLHVAAIGLSYDLLLAYATITVMQRTESGVPLSPWRLALVVPAIILGLIAMYVIATFRDKEKLRTKI